MAEFSIIDQYFTRPLKHKDDVGVGDDSAVLSFSTQKQLVICTDTLVEGRHFPVHTAAHAVGWKSVAVNLSDLAAMGANPRNILLALSLPEVNHNWLAGFSQGLFECCDRHDVELIGGDTTQGSQLTITVTALGEIETGQAVYRSGAKVGDYVVVSGQIGDAAYALQHPDSALQARLDYPTPRCLLGQTLKKLASSMIDISDGLAQDLGHILKASNVGAQLFLDQLPLDPTLHQLPDQKKWQFALAGGDDYELCFTISPQNFEILKTKQLDVPITKIGIITATSDLQFEYQNQVQSISVQGYQHFG